MLMPKRVKHRKQMRGRMRGNTKGGSTVAFGEYGLKSLDRGWITNRQIEAARVAMTRKIKRGGKVWINVFPDKPYTKKPAETRMGSGKGNPEGWVAVVKPGRVMFELSGVPEDLAREAMELAVDLLRNKGECLECHAVHSFPEYQVFAPALFGTGNSDRVAIREAILDPQKAVPSHYQPVTVRLKSGESVTGKLQSRTENGLVLFTRDAQSRLQQQQIPWAYVAEQNGAPAIQKSPHSPMHEDVKALLTEDELEAVITLIRQLNRIGGRPLLPLAQEGQAG